MYLFIRKFLYLFINHHFNKFSIINFSISIFIIIFMPNNEERARLLGKDMNNKNKSNIHELQNRIAELINERDQARARIQDLQIMNNQLTEENKNLKNQAEMDNKEKQDLRNKLDEANVRKQILQNQINKNNEMIQSLQNLNVQLIEERKGLMEQNVQSGLF